MDLGSSPFVRWLLNRLLHLPCRPYPYLSVSILLYYAFTPAYVVYISCRIRMCYRVRPRFSLHRMCTLLFVRLVRIRLLVSLSLFPFYFLFLCCAVAGVEQAVVHADRYVGS